MTKTLLQKVCIFILAGISAGFMLPAYGSEGQQPSLLYIDVQQHLWGSPRGGRGITRGGQRSWGLGVALDGLIHDLVEALLLKATTLLPLISLPLWTVTV